MALFDRLRRKDPGSTSTAHNAAEMSPGSNGSAFGSAMLPMGTPSKPRPASGVAANGVGSKWSERGFVAPAGIDTGDFANRKVWISSLEIWGRIPPFLRKLEKPVDDRRLFFYLSELATRMSQGYSTIPVSSLLNVCPELLNLEAIESTAAPGEIEFPWHRIIEQVQNVRVTAMQKRESEAFPPERTETDAEPKLRLVSTPSATANAPAAPPAVSATSTQAAQENAEDFRQALMHEVEVLHEKNRQLESERQAAIDELLSAQASWRKRVDELKADRERVIRDRDTLIRQAARIRSERDAALKLGDLILDEITRCADQPAEERLRIVTQFLTSKKTAPPADPSDANSKDQCSQP